MSAYLSNRLLIKRALVYLLQQVTYDAGSGAEDAFALVTDDPSQEYKQEPFCLVMRNRSLDQKGAHEQQDHTVGFQIIITLELENAQRTRSETQDYMDNLEELVLDALDEADWNDALNGAPTPPTIPTWLLDAGEVQQYVGEGNSGALLICTIDVTVKYTLDLAT